jgi:lipopolysaccharide export system permease protein
MLLFDRYILRLFLGFLAAGLVVFVTLYLAVDVMSFALRFGDASTSSLIKYYAYQTPWIIYQLMPMACLMATLFTLSSLNKANELVALFSIGVPLVRIASPMLIAVSIVSVLTFWVGDRLLPGFAQKKNYVEFVEIRKKPGLYSTVKTNKIWYRSENVLFNIKTLNPQAARAQDITLYYFDATWNLIQLITAKEVELRGQVWELKNGIVTLFAAESSFPLSKPFDDKVISMNEDVSDIQSNTDSSQIMSINQLSKFIDRNKEAGLDTLRYEVDYHAKFSFAFAGVVMCLLGVPFSVSKARSGGAFVSLGICLLLAFGYWAAYSSSLTLGQHGVIPPLLAAWGPNIFAVILAGFFLLRTKR